MRKYEEQASTVVKNVLVETLCDLCGKKAVCGNWNPSTYHIDDVDVSVSVTCKTGEVYPEGGFGTKITVDICPQCFIKTLVPFLEEKGAKINTEDWDI